MNTPSMRTMTLIKTLVHEYTHCHGNSNAHFDLPPSQLPAHSHTPPLNKSFPAQDPMATAITNSSPTRRLEGSLQELLKKYPVGSSVLMKAIDDNHTRVLRDGMKDWKRFMQELGLTEGELRLIDLQEPQETMKRLIAMRKWRKKTGHKATYASFLEVCMRTGEEDLAEKLLSQMNNQYQGMSPRKSPRKLPAITIGDRIRALEQNFVKLADLLSNHFHNIPQEIVIDFLLNSIPEDLTQTPEYIHITLLDETDKLSELVHVTDLWHTDLLDSLVRNLGSSDCIEAMETHRAHVASFYSRVTIEECRMEEWEVREWMQDDVKTVELRLASSWDQQTLQDLNELRLELQRTAGYKRHEMRIQAVADVITFILVTEEAALARLQNINIDLFRNKNILEVRAAGRSIYHIESVKSYRTTAAVPPPHFFCPITKQIMVDPYKTGCCGKHLSRAAIEDLDHREVATESPAFASCPLCTASPVNARADPVLRDKTQALKIYCPHKHEGCHWNGEIRHLRTHWNDVKNPCRFTFVPCPKQCGKNVQRYYVEQHIKRCSIQIRCRVCGRKSERSQSYCDNCQESLAPCPYLCGDSIRPMDLLKHLKNCRTLSVTPRKEDVDAAEDQRDPQVKESKLSFLHIAQTLQEKRLKSQVIRCQLVDNLMNLSRLYGEQRSNEEKKKFCQDLREQEKSLLAQDSNLQKEIQELHKTLEQVKDKRKPVEVLSTIKLD